jgi:hypothetical protein
MYLEELKGFRGLTDTKRLNFEKWILLSIICDAYDFDIK